MSDIIKHTKEEGVKMFVITGGGSGIGRTLALTLAARNKSVLIIGRKEHTLQETAANSSLIQWLCADVSTTEGLESIRLALKNTPHIEGLINNAGLIEPIIAIKDISLKDWQHVLQTNLDAALSLPQMVYDQLKGGRVLNIGSGAAYFPIKGWGAYCVSKAALSMLTRCWQLESDSIAFASVMPGIVDTQMQMIARNSVSMDEDQINFYKRLKEHGRLVSTQTVAAFLTWLLLDVNSDEFTATEWDIYDTNHHNAWLKPPHQVLHWKF